MIPQDNPIGGGYLLTVSDLSDTFSFSEPSLVNWSSVSLFAQRLSLWRCPSRWNFDQTTDLIHVRDTVVLDRLSRFMQGLQATLSAPRLRDRCCVRAEHSEPVSMSIRGSLSATSPEATVCAVDAWDGVPLPVTMGQAPSTICARPSTKPSDAVV